MVQQQRKHMGKSVYRQPYNEDMSPNIRQGYVMVQRVPESGMPAYRKMVTFDKAVRLVHQAPHDMTHRSRGMKLSREFVVVS